MHTVRLCCQIEIDGVDLRDVDAAWFRSRIGVVSQDPRLFSMTIRENIAYGLQQVPCTACPALWCSFLL